MKDLPMFDFRSDTVTQPDAPMREVMSQAVVGDDVYGEDETTRALEERVAQLTGKEAGLFVTSGTQGNLIAMLCHARRGEEVISGVAYHTMRYEAGGMATLGGIVPCPVPVQADGSLAVADVASAIKEDDVHFATSRCLVLENTHNGLAQSKAQLDALCRLTHEAGLVTHLDGARLMNAAIATGTSAKDYAQSFDSVSLCLSKGLGAPMGSVLVGNDAFITTARRMRKMLGGGTRQAGIMAAAGLYALEHNVARLADDHHRARHLAMSLSAIEGVDAAYAEGQTNMVYMHLSSQVPEAARQSMVAALYQKGFIISPSNSAYRLVLHKDISDSAVDGLSEAISAHIGGQ